MIFNLCLFNTVCVIIIITPYLGVCISRMGFWMSCGCKRKELNFDLAPGLVCVCIKHSYYPGFGFYCPQQKESWKEGVV